MVFNQSENIQPHNKDTEVVSVRKICFINLSWVLCNWKVLKVVNLTLVFIREYRWSEHYFSVWCLGITNKKPIFRQCNIFYNYEYFFFQSVFWSLFSQRQRSQSNKEQGSLSCSSPCFRVLLCTHYGPLQCFSTYFRKLKEIGVLRPIFPDYIISCDYDRALFLYLIGSYQSPFYYSAWLCWTYKDSKRNWYSPNLYQKSFLT